MLLYIFGLLSVNPLMTIRITYGLLKIYYIYNILKLVGGIKTSGKQATSKTYPVAEKIMDKIKIYIKTNKLKNKQRLFWNENDTVVSNNYFGKILKDLLKPLNDHLTIGMIRKIYENRPLPDNLTGNQLKLLNKLVDHSMEVAQIFYKKI